MFSLLQNILLDLSMLEKGKAIDFNSGSDIICSVTHEEVLPSDTETPIAVYGLNIKDEVTGEFNQEYLRDIDIVAMMVYTELRKSVPLIN